MALLAFFTGASAEKLEARGDRLMASGHWGQAKLIYERALAKRQNTDQGHSDRCRTIEAKVQQAREGLARDHRDTALAYTEGGHLQEAREFLQLALELTRDPVLTSHLKAALASVEEGLGQLLQAVRPREETPPPAVERVESAPAVPRHDHFQALCNTLPDTVAEAYRSYGDDFMDGYLALNNGDFENAAVLLERALAAAPGNATYIPIELATAYLNVGRLSEARDLLEAFHRERPEVLPACELLCTIYWEQGDFDRAARLLEELPDALARSRAATLLKGQTLHRARRYEAARDFYRGVLATAGWDAALVRELAMAYEALNERAEARRLYGELMNQGRSCGCSADPQVRHHYAELSFAEGDRSEALLELYLAMAKEAPGRAATYFDRISRIYTARGNTAESERFHVFARRARAEHVEQSGS